MSPMVIPRGGVMVVLSKGGLDVMVVVVVVVIGPVGLALARR